jgi:hypothetical protein
VNINRQDPASVEQEIRARVAVDAQVGLLAKVSLTQNCTGELQSRVDAFVGTVDVEAAIGGLARNISAKIALAEALWSLIGAGILVPRAGNSSPRMDVGWTTVIPGAAALPPAGTSRKSPSQCQVGSPSLLPERRRRLI